MKIKDIYINEYGPYHDWSFTMGQGVQLFYGSNESGKTSLLKALRGLLFGTKGRGRADVHGHLTVTHKGDDYRIGRQGKTLDFYKLGQPAIAEEPSTYWWYGLDYKTYDRVFAITLEDLQGADIISEVDIRARFFGASGGEKLGTAVKELEAASAGLLVASANGKRKINVLLEALKEKKEALAQLEKKETDYLALQQKLEGTTKTEEELQERLNEWQEYTDSIDMVLRAWDTYKRAEEAKSKMAELADTKKLDREAFLALDAQLANCHEHMRIWRGKEEDLMPDHFSPDSPIGQYSREIEDLYADLSKWKQLDKECAQGDAYIQKVRERLALSRRMYTAWRADRAMPEVVNWIEGERCANELRRTREAYDQWKTRQPQCPVELQNAKDVKTAKEQLDKKVEDCNQLQALFLEKQTGQLTAKRQEAETSKNHLWYGLAGLCFALAIISGVMGLMGLSLGFVGCGVFLAAAIGLGAYGWYNQRNKLAENLGQERSQEELDRVMVDLVKPYGWTLPESVEAMDAIKKEVEEERKQYYSYDVELAKYHGYEQQEAAWREEGRKLEADSSQALANWQAWLPEAASQILMDSDFFGMKQEYDQYMEQYHTLEGYEKRLADHKEALREIVDRARELWTNLGIHAVPTMVELRRIYLALQTFKKNQIRWEQKESQRKTYRDEYDTWNRKEKELLIEQQDLLQRAGIDTAGEYRKRLLAQDQYKQWDTIYQQSRVQLDLLAPIGERRELLYRRLKSGNKKKWQKESQRGQEEIASLSKRLASLYEERGQVQEEMRQIGLDTTMAKTLQQKEQLENELKQTLEDWATQVLIATFMERAQADYEKDKQPKALERASRYISLLTKGAYQLDTAQVSRGVHVIDKSGQRVPASKWSSGLADQVYLAIRLSLAQAFGEQVEPLPIILDDILVRFDEERSQSALRLLAQLAKTEQILIFTCHKRVLELAQKIEGIDCYQLSQTQVERL